MRFPTFLFVSFTIISRVGAAAPSTAPDSDYMIAGKQSYETVCFGCHQINGQGIPGAFPPLADSPWVSGDPARTAKIILHGLTGTINLAGHAYHAEMPPQGPLLSDTKIAQVLTYIRNSWGNSAPPVAPAAITALRTKFADRTEYWSATELLKQHPLETSDTSNTAPHSLTDVTYQLFTLDSPQPRLPDFSTLTPTIQGQAPENRPSLSVRPKGEAPIAIIFQGKIAIEKRGEYTFHLESDNGSQFFINGKQVINNNGNHTARVRHRKIILPKGSHSFSLHYFDNGGAAKLALAWESANFGLTTLSEDQVTAIKSIPEIMLTASGHRARIYRNFITGSTARAIGVGYPGAINLAWDANAMRPALIWRGSFIDASRHWVGRGQGFQPPANINAFALVAGPPLAALESEDTPWPETAARESSALRSTDTIFRGYQLDQNGWPTFHYTIGSLKISDQITPVLDNSLPVEQQATDSLTRTLKISNGAATLHHRIARGSIEDIGNQTYMIDEKLKITLVASANKPILRKNTGSQELLIPATPGTEIVTTLTFLQ